MKSLFLWDSWHSYKISYMAVHVIWYGKFIFLLNTLIGQENHQNICFYIFPGILYWLRLFSTCSYGWGMLMKSQLRLLLSSCWIVLFYWILSCLPTRWKRICYSESQWVFLLIQNKYIPKCASMFLIDLSLSLPIYDENLLDTQIITS